MKYDVIIVGGGTSGVSAAYILGKLGAKVLLIEKNSFLGGTITASQVIPVMKTVKSDLNTEFYREFVSKMKVSNAQITYSDGNDGWFNFELAKTVLDEMMLDANVDILFNTNLLEVEKSDNMITKVKVSHKMLSLYFEAKYFIDATGDANLAFASGCGFLEDKTDEQAVSLRFLMSGVNVKTFSDWIMGFDKDRNVTSSCVVGDEIHVSTACTWDADRNWALKPLFEKAVVDGVLKTTDTAYFQLFSVPNMPSSIAFNCPRISLGKTVNPLDAFDTSKALIEGRKQVLRLANFCKKYLQGFEAAYVSNMADDLGVRESRRVSGKYVLTADDIIDSKEFENPALISDYPIDIHSCQKNDSVLQYIQKPYQVPIECLMSKEFDNLFVVGRCLSADFYAQASVRTQTSCFSMGEAVARHIFKTINLC